MTIKCIENGETASVFPSRNKITGFYGVELVVTWDKKVLMFYDTKDPEDILYDDVTNQFEIIEK